MHFEAAVDKVERLADQHEYDLGWEIRMTVSRVVDNLSYRELLDLAADDRVRCDEIFYALRYHVKRALFDRAERRISSIPGYHENPWPLYGREENDHD